MTKTLTVGLALAFILCEFLAGAAVASENQFPELLKRKDWDRGCADWQQSIFPGTREANPALLAEKGAHDFRFQAKLVVDRMRGESVQEFRQSIEQIVRDPSLYQNWVMPGINQHPEGGSYFVTVDGLSERRLSLTSFDLTGPFSFKLLWFKRKGTTTIQFRVYDEVPPPCEMFGTDATRKRTLVRFRMIPRPDLLEWMIAEVWILEGDSQIELRLRSALRPAPLIFELMPLSVIEKDLKFRAQRMLENLIEFRRNRALKK